MRQELYYDDKDQGVEVNERRSYHTHGVAPKLERERVIVYEFFVKLFGEEVDGRSYNNSEAWKIAWSLETKIHKDNPKQEEKDDTSPADLELFREIFNQSEDETNVQDEDILDEVPDGLSGIMTNDQVDIDENLHTAKHLTGVHKYALSNIFELGATLLSNKNICHIRTKNIVERGGQKISLKICTIK